MNPESPPAVPSPVDVVVVGAGISGLAAARSLVSAGHSVKVLEKSRGVGGRMASRRRGDVRFDHGAQFFTTRSAEFSGLVDEAVEAGAVVEWTRGFGEADGYPRWRGTEAMTSLAKWMGADLDVVTETTVVDLADHPARAYVLTAPVPQSLAVLSMSKLLPDPELALRLATEIAYRPTIAVMSTFEGSTNLADHGGHQAHDDPAVTFVADNRAKGVSSVPALTFHLSEEWSHRWWKGDDDELVAAVWAAAADVVGEATPVESSVMRWRYAGPTRMWPEKCVVWGDEPLVALAGEAFDGPKVEGAFLSGLAAADAVAGHL